MYFLFLHIPLSDSLIHSLSLTLFHSFSHFLDIHSDESKYKYVFISLLQGVRVAVFSVFCALVSVLQFICAKTIDKKPAIYITRPHLSIPPAPTTPLADLPRFRIPVSKRPLVFIFWVVVFLFFLDSQCPSYFFFLFVFIPDSLNLFCV